MGLFLWTECVDPKGEEDKPFLTYVLFIPSLQEQQLQRELREQLEREIEDCGALKGSLYASCTSFINSVSRTAACTCQDFNHLEELVTSASRGLDSR